MMCIINLGCIIKTDPMSSECQALFDYSELTRWRRFKQSAHKMRWNRLQTWPLKLGWLNSVHLKDPPVMTPVTAWSRAAHKTTHTSAPDICMCESEGPPQKLSLMGLEQTVCLHHCLRMRTRQKMRPFLPTCLLHPHLPLHLTKGGFEGWQSEARLFSTQPNKYLCSFPHYAVRCHLPA